MASSLFSGNPQQAKTSSNVMDAAKKISGLLGMMRGKDPTQIAESFARVNPQFAEFYSKNWNRPIEDIARDYGISVDDIKAVMKLL